MVTKSDRTDPLAGNRSTPTHTRHSQRRGLCAIKPGVTPGTRTDCPSTPRPLCHTARRYPGYEDGLPFNPNGVAPQSPALPRVRGRIALQRRGRCAPKPGFTPDMRTDGPSTPTALCHKARGCAVLRATPGALGRSATTTTWLCRGNGMVDHPVPGRLRY